MLVKSRSIVLHRYPYSDSSWIVKALTEENGIESFIIKGGKRKESPFKGALDPLALSEIVYRQTPQKADGGLQFVKEASLLNWHGNIRNDLMNQAISQVMAEIILRYAPHGVPLQDEFLLLHDALEQLDAHPDDSHIFSNWLLGTCELWGYHLDLNVCSRCESELTGPAADFHPESGGLICKTCQGVETPRAKPETLSGLWQLNTQTFANFAPCREFVENALLTYLRNHIGFLKDLNSLQFLNEIRRMMH